MHLKALWNVVHLAPLLTTFAQEEILLNVVLIPLEKHCTGKKFVQCYPRVSRQHCTGKSPAQSCLNTTGTTLHR